jgi:glycosyltransferase involved in cell wall biosynthesis
MKFSIVTSFFDTEKYVEQLYGSILSQTYQNWEWVVTDDFSKNSAKGKLLEISKKDSRVRYIDQKFKQELYWNPHKYSSPNSDFVIQFDSDDIYYPKLLEIYKHFFMLHSDVNCLVSGGQRKIEGGDWKNYLFGDTRYLNSADWRTKYGPSETMLVTRAWRHIPYPTLNFNPEDKYKKRLGDLNLLLKLEEIGKILCLNRNLSEITVRKTSLSNASELMIHNNSEVKETKDQIIKDLDQRRKGKIYSTIKKVYDDEFDFLCAFYFNGPNKSNKFNTVNLLNPSVTARQLEVASELYFDLEFKKGPFLPSTSYNYFIIQNEEDLNFLKGIKKHSGLIIYTTLNISFEDLKNEVLNGCAYTFRGLGDKKWINVI